MTLLKKITFNNLHAMHGITEVEKHENSTKKILLSQMAVVRLVFS